MIYLLLYKVLNIVFQGLYIALLIRVLISWIPHNPSHSIIQFVYKITDPLLTPFQNIIPANKIGIDLSPIFAFMALGILRRLVFSLL
jgi:YggT family protein